MNLLDIKYIVLMFLNIINGLNMNFFDVGLITGVVVITINFYRLNTQIKYIKNVMEKITKKLGIELFDEFE